MDKVKEFVKNGGFKGLSHIEKNYDCAAFCKTPLFYITKPFTEQPTDYCLNAFVDKIAVGAFRPVAIVSLITALVAFCGCCGSFPLCTKFNDEEEHDEMK